MSCWKHGWCWWLCRRRPRDEMQHNAEEPWPPIARSYSTVSRIQDTASRDPYLRYTKQLVAFSGFVNASNITVSGLKPSGTLQTTSAYDRTGHSTGYPPACTPPSHFLSVFFLPPPPPPHQGPDASRHLSVQVIPAQVERVERGQPPELMRHRPDEVVRVQEQLAEALQVAEGWRDFSGEAVAVQEQFFQAMQLPKRFGDRAWERGRQTVGRGWGGGHNDVLPS